MDSFYDQPRKNIFLPKNLNLEIPIAPEVAKASLLVTDQIKDSICENKPVNRIKSYNAWRQQNEQRFLKKQEKKEQSSSTKPVALLKEPFERLYLSNIPNRQLDCSLINPEITDSHKNGIALKKDCNEEKGLKNKENLKPVVRTRENSKEIQQIEDSDSDLNLSHLKKILDKLESLNNSQESQLPTVQELYKVIDKKDEQIKNLENQVETLLRINSSLLQLQEQQLAVSKSNIPKENQKMSVGLMTSFAVSLNSNSKSNLEEVKRNTYKKSKDRQLSFEKRTNSLSEESFSNHSQSDDSNHASEVAFNGVHFSLDNSFDNSLNEYHSDREVNNGLSRNSDTGLTFYDNIMGQVNQFLGNKSSKSSMKKSISSEINNVNCKRESKSSIKKVTKLQNKNCNNDYNDVSAVVKKVLIKYLPQIEEAGRNNRKERHKVQNNVEASFTTLQYQQKYCLVQSQYENRNNFNYVPSKNKRRHHV